MKPNTLIVTKDFTREFNSIVEALKKDQVLVGIPADNSGRDEGGINNAALLAIANFGSPANNIPAWPVMAIGIQNAKPEIAAQFKRAAVKALTGDVGEVSASYQRAGIVASNSIKKVINAQEGVPDNRPAQATLAAREARGFKGTKYWIVTGQMRNAITYVVK